MKTKDFIPLDGEVFIGTKRYRLDGLSAGKLEHLLQLAQIEIDNYRRAIQNYPPDRMEKYGKPFLERLAATKNEIAGRLESVRTRI